MQSIRNLEYQQCRICYDSTSNLQLLTSSAESSLLTADKTYAQLLLEVCNINVMNDKPLGRWPQFICLSCSRKLKLAHDFIQHTQKINKLLQSIADLLHTRSESDFIEKPALDIPLEIKTEKDDDLDSPSHERKFQYSPVDVDVTKSASSFHSNEIYGNIPCTNNTSKEFKNYNKINDKNDSENIKEIIVPSTIEFISNDVIIKEDLEKFHRKIINNMGSTIQNDDTDVECVDDNLLCTPEANTSNAPTDVACNACKELFPSIWKLKRHKCFSNTSENIETHCTICSQSFARPYNYQRHMKTVHKRKLFKQKQTNQMPKKKKIIQHFKYTEKIKTNNKLEGFTCGICKKRFLNERRLIRHKRYTHISEEEKITCNLCGHKFARPDNYQSHVKRVHNMDKQQLQKYCCSRCDRTYSRRSFLYKHERKVHGSK